MLKYIVLVAMLFCVVNDTALEWNDSLQLTWTHFKGQPDETKEAVAVTASGITFGYSLGETNGIYTRFTAIAKAHFYPEESWYKPTKVNDTVLAHERLHFDITEWHVRELRKQFTSVQVSQNIQVELETLYQNASLKLRATQQQYDAETSHSVNVPEQLRWQKLVALELKKLEVFKEK